MTYKRPQAMDYYGVEFIDDGAYGKISVVEISAPWALSHPHAKLFPIEYIWDISDKKYINKIIKEESEYIELLRSDIIKNGIRLPLTVVYDRAFTLRLQDGNHRLVATKSIPDYTEIPIVFEHVKKITAPGINVEELLPTFVYEHAKKTCGPS